MPCDSGGGEALPSPSRQTPPADIPENETSKEHEHNDCKDNLSWTKSILFRDQFVENVTKDFESLT